MRRTAAVFALVAYVAMIVGANWLTSRFGLVPVLFGLVTTAGTYCAGLALLARDAVHETVGRLGVLVAIVVGAVLSFALSTPALAFASGVAFLAAELADMAVYTPLRRRGWVRAAVASGAVGAVLDSLLFLWLAGFPIWSSMPGQVLAKVLATVVVVVIVMLVRSGVSRALPGEPNREPRRA